MKTVWEIIYNRQMALHYNAPGICEVVFSGSSNPVIILSENPIGQVTGLVLSGSGAFRLSWNAFAGAICYNVYYINGENLAVILAQCVTDPFFDLPPGIGPTKVIVTPITKDGEGPPSDPLDIPGGGGQVQTVNVTAECNQTSRVEFPGVFKISRGAATAGNLTVGFTMIGSAVNGADYSLIPLFVTIPNGSNAAFVNIFPNEAALNSGKVATLVINESPFYFVGPQNSDVVLLRPMLLKISGYGGAVPLFVPPADAQVADLCEWDGTWNNLFQPVGTNVWSWEDDQGTSPYGNASIQGRHIFHAVLIGPYATPTPGSWQIEISCAVGPVLATIVWQGIKQGGDTASPAGVYLWNGAGSDHRASVTVEIVP